MAVWWGIDNPQTVRDMFIGKPYSVFLNYVAAAFGLFDLFWVQCIVIEWLYDMDVIGDVDLFDGIRYWWKKHKRTELPDSSPNLQSDMYLPVEYQKNESRDSIEGKK